MSTILLLRWSNEQNKILRIKTHNDKIASICWIPTICQTGCYVLYILGCICYLQQFFSVTLISFLLHTWRLEGSSNLFRITGLRSCSTIMQTLDCLLLGCVKDCAFSLYMPVQRRTILLTPSLSTTSSAGKFKSNFQSHSPSWITCTNQHR